MEISPGSVRRASREVLLEIRASNSWNAPSGMGSESRSGRAVGGISAASANVLRHISLSESVSWNGDCHFRGGNNAH